MGIGYLAILKKSGGRLLIYNLIKKILPSFMNTSFKESII